MTDAVFRTTDDTCPHNDKPWRCLTCCLMDLRRDLPRLERTVQNAEKGGAGGNPAFGSRVPAGFSVSALALLQDIKQAGGLNSVEAFLATHTDRDLARRVRQWRSRAALILRDALAPYPLVWPVYGPTLERVNGELKRNPDGTLVEGWRDKPIPCPVVSDQGDCAAPLLVHRDSSPSSPDYGKAAVIRCKTDDTHEWPLAQGGWLRLGVLLGGTIGGAA